MENAINTLRIQNFKSIKDATINPRRVNLIIGQPNVGKSNILEAMSLLGGMFFDKEGGKFMEGQIRYEDLRNLFYDNDWSKEIDVRSEKYGATRIKNDEGIIKFSYGNGKGFPISSVEIVKSAASKLDDVLIKEITKKKDKDNQVNFDALSYIIGSAQVNGNFKINNILDDDYGKVKKVKKYNFIPTSFHGENFRENYLRPPHGDNMVDVLQYNGAALRKEIAGLFKPYGLNFAVRVADRKFEIQKNVDGYIYDYPYSLIADTLQRIIFYLAAIESNDDSVLLFEEPEAHQFPEYISMLGEKIVESKNNQFFIATHSPYLVTEILEQMIPHDNQLDELAIFLTYYEDYQTKVKQLSDDEVKDIRGDSIDIFYNLSRFTPGDDFYA